ncbi:MAG: hypothetical protein ACOC5T_02955 [Elusimicrobiota bacterium]
MALKGFETGEGFNFSHSEKANIGIKEISKIETATIIVANDGTGDFETLQEAINTISNSGGYIQIKEGTFEVSTTINIPENISIRGAGNKTRFLRSGSITNIFQITGNNVEILNLTIEGTDTGGAGSSQVGILMDESSTILNQVIKNCEFKKLGYGIKVKADSSIISNNIFRQTLTGIEITKSFGALSLNSNLFDYFNGGEIAISSNGMNFGSIVNNTGFVTIGFTGSSSDYDISLIGNNFTENGDITFEGDRSNISGNTFSDITLTSNSSLNSVMANKIHGSVTDNGTSNTTTPNG